MAEDDAALMSGLRQSNAQLLQGFPLPTLVSGLSVVAHDEAAVALPAVTEMATVKHTLDSLFTHHAFEQLDLPTSAGDSASAFQSEHSARAQAALSGARFDMPFTFRPAPHSYAAPSSPSSTIGNTGTFASRLSWPSISETALSQATVTPTTGAEFNASTFLSDTVQQALQSSQLPPSSLNGSAGPLAAQRVKAPAVLPQPSSPDMMDLLRSPDPSSSPTKASVPFEVEIVSPSRKRKLPKSASLVSFTSSPEKQARPNKLAPSASWSGLDSLQQDVEMAVDGPEGELEATETPTRAARAPVVASTAGQSGALSLYVKYNK